MTSINIAQPVSASERDQHIQEICEADEQDSIRGFRKLKEMMADFINDKARRRSAEQRWRDLGASLSDIETTAPAPWPPRGSAGAASRSTVQLAERARNVLRSVSDDPAAGEEPLPTDAAKTRAMRQD